MKNTRPLNSGERSALRLRFPQITATELDDGIAWSDKTVAHELEDEGWEVQADTIVEVELGYACIHGLFFQGLLQAVNSV
jgi:hypothetical protein